MDRFTAIMAVVVSGATILGVWLFLVLIYPYLFMPAGEVPFWVWWLVFGGD